MFSNIEIQHVDKMDRGLAYAEACFETFRLIDGDIFCWSQHWQRLCLGLATLGIDLNNKDEQLVLQSCRNLAKHTADDCLIRLTVSGGDAAWGLLQTGKPKVSLQAMPFVTKKAPIAAMPIVYPFPLQPKLAKFTSDYAQILRAIQIWKSPNPMHHVLCSEGNIIGGLTSNILLFAQGKWHTPQSSGVLAGVVRQFFLHQKLIHAQVCPVDLLSTCEAILFINSGTFLSVVQSIQGRSLDTTHPAIASLQAALRQEKGVRLDHL